MSKKLLTLGISIVALAGCGGGSGTIHRDPPVYQPAPAHTSEVRVPPGHMPPPGKCRIWYQGRPPGHQGPIGDCAELGRRVPAGAVLISGGPAPAPATAPQPAVVPIAAPAATPAAKPAAKPAATQTSTTVNVKIPPGHMPPQGKCRAWYPGRAPGRQPPIGECAAIEKNLPQGAVLVRG